MASNILWHNLLSESNDTSKAKLVAETKGRREMKERK